MILIYSQKNTPRVRYIFKHIITRILLTPVSFTSKIEQFVAHSGPKISYISFGTLSNNQHKHPDRICMDIDVAASYIKWIIDQPAELHINELSIDPVQG